MPGEAIQVSEHASDTHIIKLSFHAVNRMTGSTCAIEGHAISPGIATGRPCFHYVGKQKTSGSGSYDMDDHLSGFAAACDELNRQLDHLVETATGRDADNAAIFSAHKMILDELRNDIANNIRTQEITARRAIEKCFQEYADFFRNLDDQYLNGRANDLDELRQLLLNLLDSQRETLSCQDASGCNIGECALGNPHILVTDELTASAVIRIRHHTGGILAGHCGINSHAAVIARSLHIPVVSGISNWQELIRPEDQLLVDGDRGILIINPDPVALQGAEEYASTYHEQYEVVDPVPGFRVMVNVDLADDVEKANSVKADGIGLYRTEFELLALNRPLDEEGQYELYSSVAVGAGGRPVYFRLFDLGSDKSAPWMTALNEPNPALGHRGARLLLDNPELLRQQARAIARVSCLAPVNMIYPMIITPEQFLRMREVIEQALADIPGTSICHGIMYEVPSACENADLLYESSDFGRVGSNDLLQYLFACDRDSDDYDIMAMGNDPAVWRILRRLTEAAKDAGKPLEICGALADTPEFIPRLIEMGIDTISTPCDNVAAVRRAALNIL